MSTGLSVEETRVRIPCMLCRILDKFLQSTYSCSAHGCVNENLAIDICGSVCSNGHIRSTIYLMGGWMYFNEGVVLIIKANVLLI